nr:hypothetical protein [Tanacetum cinerariifolium]
MGRDTVQLETTVNTISHEYLLEFTSEYDIPEALDPELPGPKDRIVDFPEGKNNRFFWVDERVFPTVVDWRMNAPKDGMPAEGAYSIEAVRALDTHHMDLFNLIRAPNPTKVKIGSRPRAPHEVPLLTLTANRVIEMDDPAAATDSSVVPSTIERSPLDFALETGASDQGTAAPKMPPFEDVPATVAPGTDQAEEVAATGSSHGGKSLAAIQLGLASTASVPEDAPTGVSDPDPLSFADPPTRPPADVAQSSQGITVAEDPESENSSSPAEVGSPGSVYRPEWGVTNGSLLDTPEACQDLVDHVAPPGYFSELRHMHNDEFLRQYNVNLARQARELEIKNLEALLEAKANTKKAAEDRSAGLSQELENMRAQFSDLQVSNERLSQQVATLQQQVSGEEKLKATFEDFKRQQDERVEQRCAKMDARMDALSIDFDEELYPHMLTAITGRRWAFADAVSAGIAKGISEGLRHGIEHGQAQLSLESIEDAPMDVIMAALYLESDTEDDAPQDIRDLRPSSSQLTISVYPEVRDPRNPWACKEEIVLADAIAANISRAEKKKKCRIVCRTHGVGSAHHARSDDVLVSAPTVVPQGLALLLMDAATQTELEDDT